MWSLGYPDHISNDPNKSQLATDTSYCHRAFFTYNANKWIMKSFRNSDYNTNSPERFLPMSASMFVLVFLSSSFSSKKVRDLKLLHALD